MRSIFYCLCALLLLPACVSSFRSFEVTDVPVSVSESGSQEVDVDFVYEVVKHKVRETLPDAYFRGMIFFGKCQDLPRLRGTLILVFAQVKTVGLSKQVVRATASIDTSRKTMALSYEDVSDFYPSTKHRAFAGDRVVKEIASVAHQHIGKLGLTECDVTLTQLDSWHVHCGPLDSFVRKCDFEIVDDQIRDTAS